MSGLDQAAVCRVALFRHFLNTRKAAEMGIIESHGASRRGVGIVPAHIAGMRLHDDCASA
jgi:hypothetical protein